MFTPSDALLEMKREKDNSFIFWFRVKVDPLKQDGGSTGILIVEMNYEDKPSFSMHIMEREDIQSEIDTKLSDGFVVETKNTLAEMLTADILKTLDEQEWGR